MARSDARGSQVIFAEKAVVSVVDGQMQLQIRCYDADAKLPVVEAHVRLYCVSKDRPVPTPLRVLRPNDEHGAALFLSFPTVIAHHIDTYSQLSPPVAVHNHTTGTVDPCGMVLRQVDSSTANREEVICPVCAEAYGTHERWRRHVRYQQMVEKKDNFPVETSHLALEENDLKPPKRATLTALRKNFQKNLSEIIVVVEGIDPLLSGTFQALHSYQIQDLVWHEHAVYSPCMQVQSDHIRVDLDEFHKVNFPKTMRERRKTAHDFLVDHMIEEEQSHRSGNDGNSNRSGNDNLYNGNPGGFIEAFLGDVEERALEDEGQSSGDENGKS
jgi:acyl-CoA thioesterase FadM